MDRTDDMEFTDSGLGLEYAILYREPGRNESRTRDEFGASADGSGYASFHCGRCGDPARTVRLSMFRETDAEDAVGGERAVVLRFALRCVSCGSRGVMKMLVNDPLSGLVARARRESEWPEPVPP